MKLKYIGKGSALIGVPARDLTAEEVLQFGNEDYLIESGLYIRDDFKFDKAEGVDMSFDKGFYKDTSKFKHDEAIKMPKKRAKDGE